MPWCSWRLYPGSAAILAASGVGETPALPGKTMQEFLSRYLGRQRDDLKPCRLLGEAGFRLSAGMILRPILHEDDKIKATCAKL